ncbi:hypothetical protein [Gordonia soli]|uniref:ABC transporter permease protein n=1 Tax=Gordonia soli NBRC 108243 TaxID=1223545 RepID=M0QN79_9ACTN|nr:hypothetical protein [Gordonia soli]GAC70125.1 hypothetical protein GS4_32_00690 [Gordonia soli NBRC 108243]
MTALVDAAVQVARGTRAEAVRSGGTRSAILLAAIPCAILLPTAITFGVAAVAERFATIPGEIQVTAATSTNSVYWVITLTTIVIAATATYSHAITLRGRDDDLDRWLFPRACTPILARWLFYGVAGAVCSALLVAATMLLLPALFPAVYGAVDLWSGVGARFVVTVPIYTFLVCGLGIAVAAIVGHPAGAIAVLLFWVYVVENMISLVPNGYALQSYMPFLNGIAGTGQELAFTPPWGVDGGLVYLAVVTAVAMSIGCGVSMLRRR